VLAARSVVLSLIFRRTIMKRTISTLLLAAILSHALTPHAAASQQDATKSVQQSQPPAASQAAAPNAARSEAAPKPDAPDAPAGVKIPAGVRVELEMAHTIDSQTTRRGDAVSLRVVNPVVVAGVTVISVGATATAMVVKAERNGHFGRAGRITWELQEVTAVDGTRVPLTAQGHAVGDSKGAKVATIMALSVLSPLALGAGFRRGENAVVPEGKRFDAFTRAEALVNATARR
jgi:hypothetical protein